MFLFVHSLAPDLFSLIDQDIFCVHFFRTTPDFDLNRIQDENTRAEIMRLLNVIEQMNTHLYEAQAEIQRLRDEINRLKGEQGQPKVKGNTPKLPSNHSSVAERRKPCERHKGSKKATIQIQREQELLIDPTILPDDAEFKGYEETTISLH